MLRSIARLSLARSAAASLSSSSSLSSSPLSSSRSASSTPMRVALTGASGAIGYATLFRIASGAMLGADQPIELRLLELPAGMKALEGVVMEINDCAFPLVSKIVATDKPEEAFEGCNVALLIGAKPRGPGMERGDLLRDNGNIFRGQGAALNAVADRDNLRVCVVGNPANTNAWIASQSAPDIDPKCFTAMTRLDHNRGLSQLATRLQCGVGEFSRFTIWGNHSSTQYPDVNHASVGGKSLVEAINDQEWTRNTFIPTVQKRGAAIIAARGASSAASAGSSAIDHIHDWVHGTAKGDWTSMAIPSDGSYGTTEGLYYSFPVTCQNGKYEIVQGLEIDEFSRERMDITDKELIDERDTVIRELGL